MKKLMLFLLLCAVSIFTKAQTADNAIPCDVNVATVCFANGCNLVQALGAVTVPGSSTGTALATGTCPLGSQKGYVVCCSPSTPPSPGCTRINDGTSPICTIYPQTGTFGCCGSTVTVEWVSGVMKIHF